MFRSRTNSLIHATVFLSVKCKFTTKISMQNFYQRWIHVQISRMFSARPQNDNFLCNRISKCKCPQLRIKFASRNFVLLPYRADLTKKEKNREVRRVPEKLNRRNRLQKFEYGKFEWITNVYMSFYTDREWAKK